MSNIKGFDTTEEMFAYLEEGSRQEMEAMKRNEFRGFGLVPFLTLTPIYARE